MSNLVSHVLRVSFIPMISKRMTFWSLRGWTNQVTFGHETIFCPPHSLHLIGHFTRLTHPCVERNNASFWTNVSWQSFRPVWSSIYSFCVMKWVWYLLSNRVETTDNQPVKISGKFVLLQMYKFDCLLLTIHFRGSEARLTYNGAYAHDFKSHEKGQCWHWFWSIKSWTKL